HRPGGVILFGNFNRGVRHRAATVFRRTKFAADQFDPGTKLSKGITGMRALQFLIHRHDFFAERLEIFRNQQIPGFEMAIQRHFIRLCRSRYFVDADIANPAGIEELTCGLENSFSRRDFDRLFSRLGCSHVFSCYALDTLLTSKYLTDCYWSVPHSSCVVTLICRQSEPRSPCRNPSALPGARGDEPSALNDVP